MDPTVTAAIIAVPATVITAAAAYAAGRAQARGAHRGPIDAVRRQHQRDAYAAFLAALQAYQAATVWDTCYERAEADVLATGAPPSASLAEVVAERARMHVLTVSVDELMRTGATVDLEGPEDVAAAAMITVGAARQIRMVARWPFSSYDDHVTVVDAHERLGLAISGFVKVARAHLNGAAG
ncbi:hypothetical protein CFC35_10265 [Streptomyces sp. FBKL.4005]|uniref:hypothetical protein n=1 Tax=unclassified Streptomyces TaxID=2593676 RepID=UPI000B961753|nr:hypothetical protein [Streptomyces sp. FBKL.4005]OYP14844.1 hypothetical protein CFC35_10265 [Streptomyces sp. FBKL.4005]